MNKSQIVDINILIYHIVNTAKMRSPVDTGNLRMNGLVVEGDTIIGGNEKVPYFEFTNNKGKNEGWFDNAVIQAVMTFCESFGYDCKIDRG